MMNKTAHIAAATALVIALAATPVFAEGHNKREAEDHGPFCSKQEREDDEGPECGRMSTLGTVSAVDSTASIVTIKNADGKDVQIHVNPYTFIRLTGSRTPQKVTDIKVGDWLGVDVFNTGTTVLEAHHITITRG